MKNDTLEVSAHIAFAEVRGRSQVRDAEFCRGGGSNVCFYFFFLARDLEA